MFAALRPYLTAGLALTTAGIVAVAPLPGQASLPVVDSAVTLTAGDGSLDGLLNVPLNLAQDIFNIPFNEVNALDLFGRSMIWSGPWLSVSATNLWGEDPGDQGHFAGILGALMPFPQMSGLYDPLPGYVNPDAGDADSPYANLPDFNWTQAADGDAGMIQQIILALDAEIPVSASSDATYSSPLFPVPPITGLTSIDRLIWGSGILSGGQQFPLTDNWFKVPVQDLENGYTFGEVANPSAGPDAGGQVITDNAFGSQWIPYGFPGTSDGGPSDAGGTLQTDWLMPWAGQEFKLDLGQPLQNFFNSLTQPIDSDFWSTTSDDPLTGFHVPSVDSIAHMVQNFAAGLVIAFDPFVPGSALFCQGDCTWGTDALKDVVSGINSLYPGNTALTQWLDLINTDADGPGGLANPFGLTNGATQQGVNATTAFGNSMQSMFDFGNPDPSDPPDSVETPLAFPVSDTMQDLINLFQPLREALEPIATSLGYEPIDYSTNAWWGGPTDTDGSTDAVPSDAVPSDAAADLDLTDPAALGDAV